jgi:lysozyme
MNDASRTARTSFPALLGALSLGAALASGCASQAQSDCAALEEGARICADGPTVRGIDVSYYQSVVDWPKVKGAGMTFAIARISDGIRTKDTQFANNWAGIKAAGLIRGSYQFFRPSVDPIAQADLVIQALADNGGLLDEDLPPVIDLEVTDGKTTTEVVTAAKAWIARIEDKLHRTPIMYTGNNLASVTGNNFSKYPLWVPNYTTQCPLVPSGWTDWVMWQNSSTGSVAGVAGNVDTNYYNGDAASLVQFVRSTVLPKPMADGGTPPPPADGGTAPEPADAGPPPSTDLAFDPCAR